MTYIVRTPVVLLCFNRPEETARALRAIRAARPAKMYVIADGPRTAIAGEAERCAEVRRLATTPDWPCEVLTDFATENMGCRRRVSSGLTWAFAQSEELIILEDDCVAHLDFFRFCDELLMRYRDDARVFAISGDNFQKGPPRTANSYYFSQIFHCWGWASWRRSWNSVDLEMTDWPAVRDGGWLHDSLADRGLVNYFSRAFEETFRGLNSSWAYRASFSSLSQGRVNILPHCNLVNNIGFGPDATHTQNADHVARETAGLGFPLVHPSYVIADRDADRKTFSGPSRSFGTRVAGRLRRLLK